MDTLENQEGSTPEFVDEKSITLRKPVVVGGVTYDTLHLREPEAGELDKASRAQTQVGVVISLISQVAKVPVLVVSKLCQRDLKEASDFLGSFSDDAPETGETLSPS
jgi:hypothetical protein